MLVSRSPTPWKLCAVCCRKALCNNYGILSCDACKMFFRRVVLLNLEYKCERTGSCFENLDMKSKTSPRCRACRFQKCLQVGMVFRPVSRLNRTENDDVASLIGRLLYLDTRRSNCLMNKFTRENPGLREMMERRRVHVVAQETATMSVHDWRFFVMFTTVDFLLSLDFMKSLEIEEKVPILKSFAAKATLLFNAFRTFRAKSDKLITPGGHEIVPEELQTVCQVSLDFICRIRSRLVAKLIQLNTSSEEFLLVTLILFCNPGVFPSNERARDLISVQQDVYSSALFRHCLLTHQSAAPSRFTELLSLCHVINKNMEDIQNLAFIVRLNDATECKKLFNDII